MQVGALYDHGKMAVPEKETIGNVSVIKTNIGKQLDEILGQYRHGDFSRTPAQDKDAWHAHLEERYR